MVGALATPARTSCSDFLDENLTTERNTDFFNAKLKLDGVLWIGNIEIHESSSDWFKHGHHADAGYNSVILHIASEIDKEISRSNGERIPQIQLICPEAVRTLSLIHI